MSTTIPTAEDRRVVTDGGAEELRFLEVAAETDGRRTLVEATIAPGTATPPHVHATYGEAFEVLEGELAVEVDGARVVLRPGERFTAPLGSVHRFANETQAPVRFRCALEPASRGFEEAQQMVEGLERDGRLVVGPLARDPRILGVGLLLSDSSLAGPAGVVMPLFRLLGRWGRRAGVEDELRARYVRW